MSLPLYHMSFTLGDLRQSSGHRGLIFDKFCSTWRQGAQGRGAPRSWTLTADGDRSPKSEWLSVIADRSAGHADELEEARARRVALFCGAPGRLAIYKTVSRFVTGLGRANPVENGFTWHHTLGVPYWPGSSLKGLLKSAIAELALEDQELLRTALGSEAASGDLILFDAIPLAPVKLEVDHLTPHAGNWTPDNPPGDWLSPTPIPFLTVQAGTKFLFAFRVREGAPEASRILDLAERALEIGLEILGAGAKTSVGYGRFAREPKDQELIGQWMQALTKEREAAKRVANLDPFELEILEAVDKSLPAGNKLGVHRLQKYEEFCASRSVSDKLAYLLKVKSLLVDAKEWKEKTERRDPSKDKAHVRTLKVIELIKKLDPNA